MKTLGLLCVVLVVMLPIQAAAKETHFAVPAANKWTLPGPDAMTTPTTHAAVTSGTCPHSSVQNCLFVIGGRSTSHDPVFSSGVSIFNPTLNGWFTAASVSGKGRDDMEAATAPCTGGGTSLCVYVVGGFIDQTKFSQPIASVEAYVAKSGMWIGHRSMTTPRANFGMATAPCRTALIRMCLYAFGGDTSGGLTTSGEMYDPTRDQWSKIAPLNEAVDGHGVAGPCPKHIAAVCLYMIPAQLNRAAESYDPSTNKWSTLPVGTSSTQNPATAVTACPSGSGTCVYVVGGRASGGMATSSVQVFDPSKNSWTAGPSMIRDRLNPEAATAPCVRSTNETCLYALGGGGQSIEFLAPGSTSWIDSQTLDVDRTQLAATTAPCERAVAHTCVYIAGGFSSQTRRDVYWVEQYNPGTGAWQASFPSHNRNTGVTSAGAVSAPCQAHRKQTCVYVMGGDGPNGPVRRVSVLNTSSGVWFLGVSLPTARDSFGAASAPCDNNLGRTCVYVAGGNGVHGPLRGTQMFDPVRRTWSNVANLHWSRANMGAVTAPCTAPATGTCFYVIGGGTAVPVPWVTEYVPADNAWHAVSSLPGAESNLDAVTAPCAHALARTCIYAIGGWSGAGALPTTDFYNPSTGKWASTANLLVPRADLGTATAPCFGDPQAACIYAIGGDDGLAFNTMEMYRPG